MPDYFFRFRDVKRFFKETVFWPILSRFGNRNVVVFGKVVTKYFFPQKKTPFFKPTKCLVGSFVRRKRNRTQSVRFADKETGLYNIMTVARWRPGEAFSPRIVEVEPDVTAYPTHNDYNKILRCIVVQTSFPPTSSLITPTLCTSFYKRHTIV